MADGHDDALEVAVQPPASSAARTARLRREFAAGSRERGVRELARNLGLGKSAVQRLLQTQKAEGLLDHDPASGTYALSLVM